MQLQQAAFNRFLAGIGQHAQWRSSALCPCVSPHSGAPDPSCNVCSGRGIIWAAPVACVIGSAGRDTMRTWAQFGQFDAGDMVAIIGSDSPAYAIAENDRVTMLDRVEPFAVNVISGVQDRVRWPVVAVDSASTIVSGALVNLDPPTVGADGALVWSGDAPAPGATVALTGRKQAEFFVFNDRVFVRQHHGGAQLPRRVVLRRFDLFQRAGGT